jgi:hypothetical protein
MPNFFFSFALYQYFFPPSIIIIIIINNNTSNNRGNCNHLKIIQKIPEQRTGKARHRGTTENSHIGHDTHTS